MKYLFAAIIIGTLDILLIAYLHSYLGTVNLVILYLTTTLIGGIILWLNYSKFKLSRSTLQGQDKNYWKKLRTSGKLSEEELEKQKPVAFVIIYIICFVLVLLPGLMTDLLAILFLFPPVSQRLESIFLRLANSSTATKN